MSRISKKQKIVISASRRTDIPAFYMEWFMEQIDRGGFEVKNPFNNKTSHVPASPENVHTIVFWSKNFELFLGKGYGETLRDKGYNLFFNFTINSHDTLLEPNLPELGKRLLQMKRLSDVFGNTSINWRFDPLCTYISNGKTCDNLADFTHIASSVADSGVKTCITSFIDNYGKVEKRCARIHDFEFTEPSVESKVDMLLNMEAVAATFTIDLMLCCENKIFSRLPATSTISQSACIDNNLLKRVFGGNISVAKDSGQRTKMGCGCKKSYDIGSYSQHPCSHNCLYCYANPRSPEKKDH